VILCTHRQLFAKRPSWGPPEHPDCTGVLRIDAETEHSEVWIAVCDHCGFELGVPPRQQERWRSRQERDVPYLRAV
jgi:hypothetical protein